MDSPEPFLLFTSKFNELVLRYMVSGSVAAMIGTHSLDTEWHLFSRADSPDDLAKQQLPLHLDRQ